MGLGKTGFFLTLEGIDGCGKSTQAAMLLRRLTDEGVAVTATREPGGTPIGEAIRALVLNPAHRSMSAVCEALLYAASRAQLVHEVIVPALKEGRVVLCERFVDSSLVYQGFGLELGQDKVAGVNQVATGGLTPDLTVYFDVEPVVGLARVKSANRGDSRRQHEQQNEQQSYAVDLVEQRHVEFHERVRRGYLELVRREPERFRLIESDHRTPGEVGRLVWNAVWPILAERGFGRGR